MKSGFDINTISDEGYLILPLSMSRLHAGQSPEEVYEILRFFLKKLEKYSNDVILLYTNGLYFNSEDISFEKRKKTNEQMLNHSMALRKLVEKRKEFIPGALHFLPVDYIILNSPKYKDLFDKLKKLEKDDKKFQEKLKYDSKEREYNEANINFLIEEIVLHHLILERQIEFPRTLVKSDIWRLIVYPGEYLHSYSYLLKEKILKKEDKINPFGGCHYDFAKKKLFDLIQV
jgi:hypothetical protein